MFAGSSRIISAVFVALSLTTTGARCDDSRDNPKTKTVQETKLDEAGASLAQKRALLFLVQGNKEQAASELRKAVAYQEGLYQAFIKRRPCCSLEDFVQARGNVSQARVRLAEVMNDWRTLAVELPVMIHGYEAGIKAADRLLAARAIEVNEAGAAVSEYRGKIDEAKRLLELAKKKTAPDGK